MALASLTVDLSIGLAKFESDSGKAAQIVARDFEKMSRPAQALQKSIERLANSAGKTNTELLTIRAATLGLGDATIDLIQKIGGSSAAFAGVGRQGVSAMSAVGAAAEGAAAQSNALLTTLVGKLREVDAQAKALKASAVQQNDAKALSDDGLKARIASINAVAEAERKRISIAYEADKAAKASADAEAAKAAAAKASNDAYIASIEKTINAIGKSRSELVAMELAQRGLTERGAPLVAKLRDLDAATGQLGKSAFASRNKLLTLQYTISDVIASAGSGISPLTILLQQGGQVFDAFGGASAQGKGGFFRNFFGTLASVVTPARLAIGGTVGAVLALGTAMYRGAQQSKEYADAIVLSGNFAGQTEGKFNTLTRSIAASGEVNIAAARKAGQALLATGEVGPQVFDRATEAVARYAQATGKTEEEVAKDFASMSRGAAQWAIEHNRSLNVLTAAQIEQIKRFEETGRAADAQGIIYDALNARFRALEPNLGLIDRSLRAVKGEWERFWDAAYDVGRTETIDDRLRKVQERIERAKNAGTERVSQTQLDPQRRAQLAAPASRIAADSAEERDLLRAKDRQEGEAAAQAAGAAAQELATAGRATVSGWLKQAKAASEFTKEVDKLQAAFKALAAVGTPVSAKDQALALAKVRESFTDKSGASDADAQRRALLDQDLKALKDRLTQEQDALQFNQQFLQGIYSANSISLADYYAERRRLTAEGVQAELTVLEQTQLRLQQELSKGKFKNSAQKTATETQLAEAQAQAARVQIKAKREGILVDQEQDAATQALNSRISEYRANLAQLNGDEEQAFEIRTRLAVATAKLLQASAGGQITDAEIDRFKLLTELAGRINVLQRNGSLLSAASATAEEAFLLAASQRGASLLETEQGVYAIRAKSIEQLRALATEAQAIADKSQRPEDIQRAADAAFQLAKAIDTADPALNRLRESVRGVADAISNDIASAINDFKGIPDLIDAISKDLVRAGTDLLITQPLKVGLQGLLKGVSEGDNPIGNLLKGVTGVQGTAGLTAQTAAVATSTAALTELTAAATAASFALSSKVGPAAVSSGGPLSWLASLFGGSSGAVGIAGNDIALAFHSGGVVGRAGTPRAANASLFAGARRYHGGGIPGLGPHEVPAILMGGPRGRREEVLRADDPRHSDNAGQAGNVTHINVSVQAAQGMTRDSAQQQGRDIGYGIQRSMRRLG